MEPKQAETVHLVIIVGSVGFPNHFANGSSGDNRGFYWLPKPFRERFIW
jgi:hypothetical protein